MAIPIVGNHQSRELVNFLVFLICNSFLLFDKAAYLIVMKFIIM
jgi:hypothetical protein